MLIAAALDRTESLWRRLQRRVREPAELYRREAERLRVERRDGAIHVTRGADQGVAVRLAGRDGVRFGSASGGDAAAVSWAAEAARRLPATTVGDLPWEAMQVGSLVDEDDGLRVPGVDELLHVIAPLQGGDAVIESAVVVETIAAEGGLRTLRSRLRWWASEDAATSRRSWAGRRLTAIAPGPPDPAPRDTSGGPPLPLRQPIEVPAHAAGPLVAALVRAVHGAATAPFPVGSGWCVRDDPHDRDAPSGGRFDDAGFRTRARILADGVCGNPLGGGPGSLWRGSFREPPAPGPVSLVLDPAGDRPRRRIVAVRVRLDALAPRDWVLRAHGCPHDGDDPCGPPGAWIARLAPAALVEGCVAAAGGRHRGPDGVACPSVVFEVPPG